MGRSSDQYPVSVYDYGYGNSKVPTFEPLALEGVEVAVLVCLVAIRY